MDGNKKEILEKIKLLMDKTILDTKEIEWFRYMMNYLKEYKIFGKIVWILNFDEQDCPMDEYNFRKFLEDYRRDNK